MTSYVAWTTTTSSFQPGVAAAPPIIFSLAPALYEIQLTQIEYTLTNVRSTSTQFVPVMRFSPTLYRHDSGSSSGGTVTGSIPLRSGSNASSTTARWGTGVNITGTQIRVASPPPIVASKPQDVGQTFTLPFNFTVSPGGILEFNTGFIGGSGAGSGNTNSARVQIVVYFEEFQLAWRY